MVALGLANGWVDANICSLSLLAISRLEAHGEGRSDRSYGEGP